MSARETLRQEMTRHHLYMTDERADELIDAFAHELAEQHAAMLRAYPDYRGVMGLAAALILDEDHPHRKQDASADLVRPDEEPA